jgi:DNA-binding LytR/AlgR family response regulator
MKMRCMIIEDEPMARKGLEEYISEVNFLALVAQCEHPLLAMPLLQQFSPDLLLLDIQMPKLSGIDFLKTLSNPPMVIFTTAYPEYAVESYTLDVIDYLLKPISFDRFLKAVNKANDFFILKHSTKSHTLKPGYFFVKADGKFEKILFEDLLFAEALQNYVALYTKQRKILTYITLGGLEKQLPSEQFIKVHKSYIVSVRHIKSVEGNILHIGQHQIAISRSLKGEVMKRVVEATIIKR